MILLYLYDASLFGQRLGATYQMNQQIFELYTHFPFFNPLNFQSSKMNYRAWNHRCWLISYMTEEQVFITSCNNHNMKYYLTCQ